MADLKIASLFAQVGFKVDTKALETLQVRLVALKTRLNQLSTAINRSETAMAGSLRNQILAERLQITQNNNITSMYRQQAAAARAAAAQARSVAAATRASSVSRSGNTARIGTSGVSGNVNINGLGGIVAGTTAVYGLASSFMSVNMHMDKFRAGLLVSTDNAQAAAGQLSWLKQISGELGVNFAGSTQQFMMFSSTASALGYNAGQVRTMYREIAQGQSALGMSQDDAEGMTRALTQMLSKGKVMSEELKGQLAERVPGAVAIMAKAVAGGNIPKLFQMMEDGALDANTAVYAFLKTMNSSEGMKMAAAAQAQNLTASMNRLGNAWTELMDQLGKAGIKALVKDGFDATTRFVTYLSTDGIPVLKEVMQVMSDLWTNTKRVASVLWALAPAALFAATGIGAANVALWLLKLRAEGGILVNLAVMAANFFGVGTAASGAAIGVSAFAAAAAILGAGLAAAYLIYQDLTSENSWLMDQANSANWLAASVQWLYNLFTNLYTIIGNVFSMSAPEWWTAAKNVGGFISDQFGQMLGAMPTGVPTGQLGITPAAPYLTPSQATAAGGNTANNKQITIGDIIVRDAAAGKEVVSGATNGNDMLMMKAAGNVGQG